jgi:hypothetical protein
MDDCRRFEGITPEKLDRLKQGLEKSGIKVPETGNGIIEAMGVKLSVTYVAAENALDVCILDKPMFIPSSVVWAQVEGPLKN